MQRIQQLEQVSCKHCGFSINMDSAKTGKTKDYCNTDCNGKHYCFVELRLKSLLDRFDIMIKKGEIPPNNLMIFVNFCVEKVSEGYPTIILAEQLRRVKQDKGFNQHVIAYYMSIDFSKPENRKESLPA